MEITNVTQQTQDLVDIIRAAMDKKGWTLEEGTFVSALVVERACDLVTSIARGWAWQNDAKMTPAEAAIYASARGR
jgi:hypothetical protein